MLERKVTGTSKDSDGDITGLCNNSGWGKVSKAEAIRHIENNTYSYYVEVSAPRVSVTVYEANGKKHLRTVSDKTSKNNLDNLPDC